MNLEHLYQPQPPVLTQPLLDTPEAPNFECFGFFEEIWLVKGQRIIGTRRCPQQPGRKCGSAEEVNPRIVLTKPIKYNRGHKEVELFASEANPVEVFTRYYPICGRLKGSE